MENKEPTPVVPTLHSMSTPCLKTPADIASYLIRFLFANPGSTSSVNESEMISYRKLVAMYGKEPTQLAERISEMLTVSMGHYFPNKNYQAVCEVENKEGVSEEGIYQGNKAITIAITDSSGVSIIPRAAIDVNHDGSKFDIKFATKNI